MGERLKGKVAVVTGGTSGMGRGTVERFIAEGARVVVADILDEKGAALEREYKNSLLYCHCDVSREDHVRAAVKRAVASWGRLDCMFNNAGVGGVMGEIDQTDGAGFDATVGVLFKGVALGMKHAVAVMKDQRSGSIISTASVAGLQGGFGPHIYSACKAAVVHLTRTVALEVGPLGIRVNAICPGGIATSIFGRGLGLGDEDADRSAKVMEGVLGAFQPIKRSGLPADIANLALFLASDESSFVSGQAIAVDGALTAGRERPGGASPMLEILAREFPQLLGGRARE